MHPKNKMINTLILISLVSHWNGINENYAQSENI